MNSEDINDAELDAFLKGEDALSGELQAMQQASPSAELDAAILGRAEAQMARDRRPAAANDASDGGVSKPGLPRLGLRWRVPAGIAATVMAGVMTHQAWQSNADMDRAVVVSSPAPVPYSPPAAVEAKKLAPPPPPPEHHKQLAPRGSLPVPAAPAVETYVREAAPPPPLSYSPPPAVAAAPAPDVADLTRATSEASRKVEVSGRRSRAAESRSSATQPGQSGAMAAGAPDPTAWLAAIDELLKAGLRRDTLEEWDKFRAAYPDYPVPAETTGKINALRK